MTDNRLKAPGQLIALLVLAGVSLIVAVFLTGGATVAEDVELQLALTTWSNYLMVVAAIAVVGALVLSGVRSLLARTQEGRQSSD